MPVGNAWERLFGGRVKSLRSARRWTQEELARRMSAAGHPMHQTTVAKLEGGNRPTTIAEVAAIASIFGVSMAALFDTYEGEGNEQLAALANQISALTAERARLTERLTVIDAESASLQRRYNDLQRRVEAEEDEQVRQEAASERDFEAFMASAEPADFEEGGE